jgi:hypothetical protein
MDTMDSPADLRGDAEVLETAAQILRKRWPTGRYELAAISMSAPVSDLLMRSRHPQRQHLRGGTGYTPPPAPEGTEAAAR